MQRNIFIVNAFVVDANGTFNVLTGYPQTFDSRSYGNDMDKTLRRAEGAFAECYGAMCKVDTRQLQTVMLMSVDGQMIDHKHIGRVADVPYPEASNVAE